MINKIVELHEALVCKTQECEELEAENEKLKNEIKACYNQVEDFDIIATSKSNKLKQAEQKLEQIREIAMAIMDDDVEESFCYSEARQILQIIDEVHNDRQAD